MTLVVILCAFLLALPQVRQGGIYLLTLMDWYASTFSVAVFALIECLVMVWIYGMGNIEKNMKEMTGRGIPIVFKFAWYFATPVLLAVTLAFVVYTYSPPAYSDYIYPSWAVSLGWLIAVTSLVPIPVVMVVELCKAPGDGFVEKLRVSLKPTEKWGPPDEIRKTEAHNQLHVINDTFKEGSADNPGFIEDKPVTNY